MSGEAPPGPGRPLRVGVLLVSFVQPAWVLRGCDAACSDGAAQA